MSIGHFKAFTDLNPGQWFAALGDKGVKIGLVVQFSKELRPPNELRPVFVSESEAISTSPDGLQWVYTPDITDISVDTKSLSKDVIHESGDIVITSDGAFLNFKRNSHSLFANIATGRVADSHTQALWFGKWSLLEKKPEGYKSLLDFGAVLKS
jgi:hypothetical protein